MSSGQRRKANSLLLSSAGEESDDGARAGLENILIDYPTTSHKKASINNASVLGVKPEEID